MSHAHAPLHPKPIRSAGCLAALALCLTATAAYAERPQPDLEAGRQAYVQQCARCHGESGAGDGVDARRFYPRPRDLTLGKYKFRSTATGTTPSDEDLFHTITYGLPGSNMPDWQHLDEATRWQLVEYLKSLSPAFTETPPVAAQIPQDPGRKRADLTKGRQVYGQLGCAACHGANGRANGTSAAGLVDEWNMSIRPANLTQGWAYRGGATAKDIVMRVLAGIDGSGMPSYEGAIVPPEAVWQLAYYVESLQEPAHWNMIVHALKLHAALPERPGDGVWAQVEPATLRVRNVVSAEGEWSNPPTIQAMELRVAYNEEGAAFRFSWDDPTQDAADALAILLKTADGRQGDVVTLHAWPYAGSPKLDASYWKADVGQASSAVIAGFDDLARADFSGGSLNAVAVYDDGRWSIVIQRPLKPAQAGEAAAIDLRQFTGAAFAVWDGGNAGSRAVSPWIDVMFEFEKEEH